jgi:tRNA1(Val) A37 N6-methylase TrmN6
MDRHDQQASERSHRLARHLSMSVPPRLEWTLRGAAHALRPGGRLAITLRADDHHDHVVVLIRRNPGGGLASY